MNKKKSFLTRLINLSIDLLSINGIIYLISDEEYLNITFLSYISITWILISYYVGFYKVFRYTHLSKLVSLLISQTFVFGLAYLSYFSVFREGQIIQNQLITFFLIIVLITFFKFLIFFLLKKNRLKGKYFRNVILFGEYNTAKRIEKLFKDKNDLGYRFFGFFSDRSYKTNKYLGSIKDGFSYIIENNIDEIYCDATKISQRQLLQIQMFAKMNHLELRIIPENKAVYSKDFILEYFGTTPILKPKILPFEKYETHFFKRMFDLFFSLFVIVFILSWLFPILFIAIKIDSKGGFFFKQKRDGLNGGAFYCYKLRSMKINDDADIISATKNDKRVTKVGAFLRKTSLDELPQFFNVLKGDMSIVGPRPHINIQTKKYLNEVENYIIRNSVKPGITGLAQISGFRGEVLKKSDIENRVRLDVFYIENWSFFLDVKIIIQTFFKVFSKDEKAY